ncbi:MAG: hypothetical protein ACRD6R_12670 [Candidatus Polarisedimenticolia bacterium]
MKPSLGGQVAGGAHLAHPDRLERAFPSYARDREWPGSFWMRRVR